MTGSSLAPIIIPIVVIASLAAWLIMVYYADSHPFWRHSQAQPPADTAPADTMPTALPGRPEPSQESAPQRRAA